MEMHYAILQFSQPNGVEENSRRTMYVHRTLIFLFTDMHSLRGVYGYTQVGRLVGSRAVNTRR